jgi:uncharacterized protein YjbI with pentapeptide repeats
MDEDNNDQKDQSVEEHESKDEKKIEYREISEEELEKILDDHEIWLATEGEEGTNAELMGYDLKEANFSGRKLRKIFVESSDLRGQKFIDFDLKETLFLEVNFQGATFWNSDMSGANFQRSDLSNAKLWRAKLNDANLSDVNLQNSELHYIKGLSTAKIQHANFKGATGLFGNEFARNDLTGVKLPDEIKGTRSRDIPV